MQGKKGIWLKLFEDQAHLVPIAIQVVLSYSLDLSLSFGNLIVMDLFRRVLCSMMRKLDM